MTVIEWKKEKADRRVEEQRAPLYWMVYQELYYAITSGQAAPGEHLAVREACENASDMDISLLREVNQEFAEALRAGNIQGSARADERFHEEIYRIADNSVLLRTLHGLERPMYGYRVRTCRSGADVEAQIAEHETLIESLESRDVSRAQAAVTVHLTGKRRGEMRKEKNVSDRCPESFSCVS